MRYLNGILNNEDWDHIHEYMRENKYASSTQLTKFLFHENGKEVSSETLRRGLVEQGFKFKRSKQIPIITPNQTAARVEWARNHLHQNWSKILFTDITSFWLGVTKFGSGHV